MLWNFNFNGNLPSMNIGIYKKIKNGFNTEILNFYRYQSIYQLIKSCKLVFGFGKVETILSELLTQFLAEAFHHVA